MAKVKNTLEERKLIEETAQIAAERVVLEFQKKGLLKDNKQSAFQKTEILLYNYNNFKEAIKDKQEQIKNIKKMGVNKKSKSVTMYSSGSYFDNKSEDEKSEDKIQDLENSIKITKNLILVIDKSLEKLHEDEYFKIINLKYFENKKYEEIAELLEVDVSTVSRNKNRLINMLKIYLFSDDVINELFS